MSYASEKEMSLAFRDVLRGAIFEPEIDWYEELTGVAGIPDYVLLAAYAGQIDYVVAIELKLRNWKRGLQQAQRYLNFANEAYVVLDEANLVLAADTVHHFSRSGIGLASFSLDGVFRIHHLARSCKPFSSYVAQRLADRYDDLNTQSGTPEKTEPPFFYSTRGRLRMRQFRTYIESGCIGLGLAS